MTYTWTVTNLIGYPLFDGQTDVVTTAFYTVVADDGAGHTASYQSAQPTPLSAERPFVPYADLTNDIVVGWIQDELGSSGVDNIEVNLDAQIAAQIDGWRTVGDIRRHLDLPVERFEPRIERLYAVLNGLNLLLIRR